MTRRTRPQTTGRGGRIRGFSAGGRHTDIAARMTALAVFTGDDPAALRSALRACRRASLQTPQAYDAARHAALLRLLRQGSAPLRDDAGRARNGRAEKETAPSGGRRR